MPRIVKSRVGRPKLSPAESGSRVSVSITPSLREFLATVDGDSPGRAARIVLLTAAKLAREGKFSVSGNA